MYIESFVAIQTEPIHSCAYAKAGFKLFQVYVYTFLITFASASLGGTNSRASLEYVHNFSSLAIFRRSPRTQNGMLYLFGVCVCGAHNIAYRVISRRRRPWKVKTGFAKNNILYTTPNKYDFFFG